MISTPSLDRQPVSRRSTLSFTISRPARMVADANARGMPGTEIVRAYIEEAERGGHEWPVAYEIE